MKNLFNPKYPNRLPRAVSGEMPDIVGTADFAYPGGGGAAGALPVCPADLLRPMPSIVNTVPDVVVPVTDGFTAWVSDNPLLAVVGLWLAAQAFKG